MVSPRSLSTILIDLKILQIVYKRSNSLVLIESLGLLGSEWVLELDSDAMDEEKERNARKSTRIKNSKFRQWRESRRRNESLSERVKKKKKRE